MAQAFQMLYTEADANNNGRLAVLVRLILDGFASSAVIPHFDKTISIGRSRDISVSLIIQSLSQLEIMYTPAISRTIINNYDHIFYLGSQDLDTTNYIATRATRTSEAVLSMPHSKTYLIVGSLSGQNCPLQHSQ